MGTTHLITLLSADFALIITELCDHHLNPLALEIVHPRTLREQGRDHFYRLTKYIHAFKQLYK
jgi:hypothetical protein